jgi:hypothetical protein
VTAEPDLYDEESQDATDREVAWMWLHDLNERVLELEELAGWFPRWRDLRVPSRGQGSLW